MSRTQLHLFPRGQVKVGRRGTGGFLAGYKLVRAMFSTVTYPGDQELPNDKLWTKTLVRNSLV